MTIVLSEDRVNLNTPSIKSGPLTAADRLTATHEQAFIPDGIAHHVRSPALAQIPPVLADPGKPRSCLYLPAVINHDQRLHVRFGAHQRHHPLHAGLWS